MKDRCEKYEMFKKVDSAFRAGDLEGLRASLGNPKGFPNVCGPEGISCSCLQYAIYHSPIAFIMTLIENAADPNYDDGDGFPSLIAALTTDRDEKYTILELLLSSGADVNQRGINDYTPLHLAAVQDDQTAIEILARWGADLNARTRVDDWTTPLEEAKILGRHRAVLALERLVAQ